MVDNLQGIAPHKIKVAFICVHNSCRSQIAEALGKKLVGDVFEIFSAGTELKDHINPDAVRMMKQMHHIDMEQSQFNKLLSDIPEPDEAFVYTINTIEQKVLELKSKLAHIKEVLDGKQ